MKYSYNIGILLHLTVHYYDSIQYIFKPNYNRYNKIELFYEIIKNPETQLIS